MHKCGLSLLELMMTTVLIVVLAGVGYTSFSNGIESQSAKTGAGQISYAVKIAKQHARTKGVITTLDFNPGSSSFDILADSESLTDTTNVGAASGKFPDDVQIISSSCSSLGFDVNGTLVDSSGTPIYNDCLVVVGYSGGPQETLTIKGKTGNVEYE